MSDVSSGLVKLAYRGVAGFFVLLFMFVFGVIGITASFAGGLVVALSWIPMASPEILSEINIFFGSSQSITNPVLATLALLIGGAVLLAAGFFFIVITAIIGKGAIIIDKEIASIVENAFSSGKDRISSLERLATLRDRGVLTEKEFMLEKDLILSKDSYEED
ncbi:MAG: SHOCT domain-containing protein [Candidatus Hodarchaeales archaeon]|jgi:hypothetical protein